MAPDATGRDWCSEFKVDCEKGHRPAVILFAAAHPNGMQSALPTVCWQSLHHPWRTGSDDGVPFRLVPRYLQALHPVADMPLINHNIEAALKVNPKQIIIVADAQHMEAIRQAGHISILALTCQAHATCTNFETQSPRNFPAECGFLLCCSGGAAGIS